ncbi:MAG: DNA-binding protein [Candidatus Bathyarchaeia archaeon]
MSKIDAEQKPEEKPAETKVEEAPTPKTPAAEKKPTAPAPEKAAPERTSPPNHIYIGKKPVMSYAMSALIQLSHSGEIVLKARGLAISRAVDVAEIVTKRLGNDAYDIKDVKIDTEKLGSGDDIRSVSTMEIVVGKK